MYSAKMNLDEGLIRESVEEFHPKSALQTDDMKDMDGIQHDAVRLKFLDRPLTQQQLADFIQIPPR